MRGSRGQRTENSRWWIPSSIVIFLAFFGSAFSFAKGEDKSILLEAASRGRVELLANRGPEAINILEHTLQVLDPAEIERMPGFTGFSGLRVVLFTYDFREPAVLVAIERLLKKGARLLMVVDSSTVLPTKMPTAAAMRKWTPYQRRYFQRTYAGRAGQKVEKKHIEEHNREKLLGIKSFEKALELRDRYKRQVEIVTSPREIVPVGDQRFPRLQHKKGLFLESKRGQRPGNVFYARLGSSNFTDAGMDPRGRIVATEENIEAFVNGREAKRMPGSKGHIQMNIEFKLGAPDETWISPMLEPFWDLHEAFKKGKHFNDIAPRQLRLPKVIFNDRTVVQAFYSEGESRTDRQTEDPIRAILSEYLSNPAMKLQRVFETQFVFTHHWKARRLRKMLSEAQKEGSLEDFFVGVDGSFSVETESALDDMLFSEQVSLRETLMGKAILSPDPVLNDEDWRPHAYSFQGAPWKIQQPRHADKLHTKFAYYKYEDDHGVVRHVVVIGSGNSSTNAFKGNSDVFFVIDSEDPRFEDAVDLFKKHLLEEEKRLFSLDKVWLAKSLALYFEGDSLDSLIEKDESFLESFSDLLTHQAKGSMSFRELASALKGLKVSGESGSNLLSILAWYGKYQRLVDRFSWEEYDLMLRLAGTHVSKTEAFIKDLRYRWTSQYHPLTTSSRDLLSREKSFNALIKKLDVFSHSSTVDVEEPSPRTKKEKIIAENMEKNCQHFLRIDGWHPREMLRRLKGDN